MKLLLFIAVLALTGCAKRGGSWPAGSQLRIIITDDKGDTVKLADGTQWIKIQIR